MEAGGFKIIQLLKEYSFLVTDVQSLENFESRDGFEIITDQDLEGMIDFFKQYPDDFEDLLPIITDGNSNYLCVYFKGNDKGKVCHLSHDEMDLSPRFKNIENLIKTINANPEAWDFEELPDGSFDF
ncbi:SMI1/KNR4 family protein [Pedobacter caeni]|uniref:SMI1 / KNR4 family (SUKH-1) n=1 Tax=Pedobacter caeni TaxID=288992 RepID=A0A1M5JS66_9SPHI|nr:SMI1/KNR4 family protein [Pedobacter caeni]SHG43401.1 hypothetical protein SAMN04488522_105491 [Pedobacter caeni]